MVDYVPDSRIDSLGLTVMLLLVIMGPSYAFDREIRRGSALKRLLSGVRATIHHGFARILDMMVPSQSITWSSTS